MSKEAAVRPRSPIAGVAVGAAGLALLGIGAPLLLVVLISPHTPVGCGPRGGSSDGQIVAVAAGPAARNLTAGQRRNAAAIITTGRRRRLPDQAIVVALAVASQESRFTNYANDGRGGDLVWSQAGIARSLSLPHEAVGSDHGSLGVFQQQWPWWGSMRELMTPAIAAGKFYDSLTQVPGWDSMPVTVAAQRVQRSAYPSAYADDEPLARRLLAVPGVTAAALPKGMP